MTSLGLSQLKVKMHVHSRDTECRKSWSLDIKFLCFDFIKFYSELIVLCLFVLCFASRMATYWLTHPLEESLIYWGLGDVTKRLPACKSWSSKFLLIEKLHIFQCMGEIFWVEFQRVPFKFYINILPIHWRMKFLYKAENLGALIFDYAYICRSPLVHEMTCCLFAAMPLSEPVLTLCVLHFSAKV